MGKVKTVTKKAAVKKAPEELPVTQTKVVRANPAAKTIENNVSKSPKRPGVRLVKKIQTAEGWKREQKRIRAKK